MPIKDLSERLRIPRLGKIRLGIKATNAQGKEYPKAVDYFVSDNADFHKTFGDKPKTIRIAFPTDDPGDWASQFYRAYSRTRGLLCKGNGEGCRRLVIPERIQQTGDVTLLTHEDKGDTAWLELSCPGKGCEFYASGQCREIMMLQFLLPELPGLGIWQLDTSSINSILNINSGVAIIKALAGKIAMLPLRLEVVDQEATPEGRKKTIHVLQLNIDGRLSDLKGRLMLPEAEDDVPELDYEREAPEAEAVDQETPDELFPTAEEQEAAGEPEQEVSPIRARWNQLVAEAKEKGVNGVPQVAEDAPDDYLQNAVTWLDRKLHPIPGQKRK